MVTANEFSKAADPGIPMPALRPQGGEATIDSPAVSRPLHLRGTAGGPG